MNRLRRSAIVGAAVIAFTGVAPPAQAQGTSQVQPQAPAQPQAQGTAAPADPPAASHRTAWPWVIMGTGVALVVTATVLEVHAVSEDDQRDSAETKLFSLPPGDPQRPALQASAASHDDSAKNGRTAALIIGSVGFVAMAGAVVLWFVEGGSSESASASSPASSSARSKPSLLPSFAPGYAGASFGASF